MSQLLIQGCSPSLSPKSPLCLVSFCTVTGFVNETLKQYFEEGSLGVSTFRGVRDVWSGQCTKRGGWGMMHDDRKLEHLTYMVHMAC
jgi:hypothetical protein